MHIVNIQVRCRENTSENVNCQADLGLAIESAVSVALLELFSEVDVDRVEALWVEDESRHCGDSSSYPQM